MNKVRLLLVMFFVLFLASVAFAGPSISEPTAEKGRFSLGVGYFYYSGKWTSDNAGWQEVRFISNQPYVQASYGLKNMEIYFRIGTADLKINNAFASGSGISGFKNDFSDKMKPFVSAGVKGIFNITPSLGVSPFLQASLYSSYKDSTSGTFFGFPATEEIEVKSPREINLGAALQSKVRGVNLFAGPIVSFTGTTVEGKLIVPGVGTATSSATYHEKTVFGGIAGLQVPILKKLALEIQGQMKSEFSVGASVAYLF